MMKRISLSGSTALLCYVASIPAANWLITHVGTICAPNGPCLIPVAPGLLAPTGILMIGLALVLRDMIQQQLGAVWALVAIAIGGAISALIAPPTLALASAAAFLVSEITDTAIYTPLRRHGLILAVAASSLVGLIIDSFVFLWIAFGSLEFLAGQIVGKLWMVLISLAVIQTSRTRRSPFHPDDSCPCPHICRRECTHNGCLGSLCGLSQNAAR